MNRCLLSSEKMTWGTPQYFFEKCDEEFNFTIDVAASKINAKCDKYYTESDDGLLCDWSGERVWCNPPYGRELGKWVQKAAKREADIAVLLIPSRTDTSYFHDYIYNKAEIRFLRGRLRFHGAKHNAPFPSMLVIFRKES